MKTKVKYEQKRERQFFVKEEATSTLTCQVNINNRRILRIPNFEYGVVWEGSH